MGRKGWEAFIGIALYHQKNQAVLCDKSMKDYIDNNIVCRRDMLFEDVDNYRHLDFDSLCLCDICASDCKCGSCDSKKNGIKFLHIITAY